MSEKKRKGLRKISQFTGKPIDTILIIGSLAVGAIAAYAWRDLSDEVFKRYFPEEEDAVKRRLIYAVLVTILAIIIIYIFSKISNIKIRTSTTLIETTPSTSTITPTIIPSSISDTSDL